MPLAPTPAQSAAARANGARSRGPVSPAGKATSSRNALRHGLRARTLAVTRLEAAGEAADFAAEIVASLAPSGPVERELAHAVAEAFWRLRRVGRMEAEVLDAAVGTSSETGPLGLAVVRDGHGPRALETVIRYRAQASGELWRSLRLLAALRLAEAEAAPGTDEPGEGSTGERDDGTGEPDGWGDGVPDEASGTRGSEPAAAGRRTAGVDAEPTRAAVPPAPSPPALTCPSEPSRTGEPAAAAPEPSAAARSARTNEPEAPRPAPEPASPSGASAAAVLPPTGDRARADGPAGLPLAA